MDVPGFVADASLGQARAPGVGRTWATPRGVRPAQATCGAGAMCETSDGTRLCDCGPGQTCRRRVIPGACRVDPWRCFFIPFPFCLMRVCDPPLVTVDSYCQ